MKKPIFFIDAKKKISDYKRVQLLGCSMTLWIISRLSHTVTTPTAMMSRN